MGNIILSKTRTAITHIVQKPVFPDFIGYFLYTADKFRTEYQDVHISQIQAILDLISRITVIQGNSQCTCFQDTKIDRKPLQAIHQKDGNFISFLDTTFQKQVGKAVGFFVEDIPCNLTPVIGGTFRLDQFKFFPCDPPGLRQFRVDLHKTDFISVQTAILFQKLSNRHFK